MESGEENCKDFLFLVVQSSFQIKKKKKKVQNIKAMKKEISIPTKKGEKRKISVTYSLFYWYPKKVKIIQ